MSLKMKQKKSLKDSLQSLVNTAERAFELNGLLNVEEFDSVIAKGIYSSKESWWIYEGKRTSIHRMEGIMAG